MDKNLEERHEREKEFHDAKYSDGESFPQHYFADPTSAIYTEMMQDLGDLTGQAVLEYGCGDGWCTIDLCKKGADVCAFDISDEAVKSTRALLMKHGYQARSDIRVMPAEKLDYADNSFDVCFGFAILHHLDMESAIAEMHRVLKPGGIAIFAEPLQGNPLLRLYRRLTPQYRTPDEEPLLISELPNLFSAFSALHHKEYYLVGQAAMGLLYVPGLTKLYPKAKSVCWKLDEKILKRIPRLGSWAWYSVVTITK